MKHEIISTDRGRVLMLTDGKTQVGAALDFGIRVVHLSCAGMENLYYEQPADCSDGYTEKTGWRLYGGHRLWLAPESEKSYAPDNDPVSCTLTENGVILEQKTDPFLLLRKRLSVNFEPDGSIRVEHRIENAGDTPVTGASWGVNTLSGGGTATIPFPNDKAVSVFNPSRCISLWGDTDPHDPRLHFTKDSLTATFLPASEYLKLGLYVHAGQAVLENKGQRLHISFGVPAMAECPDNGCNFELFMCQNFMELETLGARKTIAPGEAVSHTEYWKLEKL